MNITAINFLNRLKGCSAKSIEQISFEYTNLTFQLARKLYQEGFLQSYRLVPDAAAKNVNKQKIVVNLRYYFDKPIFKKLKIVSKPSQTTYLDYEKIARIQTSRDILFFSTDKGILTADECKKAQIGGILFFIC